MRTTAPFLDNITTRRNDTPAAMRMWEWLDLHLSIIDPEKQAVSEAEEEKGEHDTIHDMARAIAFDHRHASPGQRKAHYQITKQSPPSEAEHTSYASHRGMGFDKHAHGHIRDYVNHPKVREAFRTMARGATDPTDAPPAIGRQTQRRKATAAVRERKANEHDLAAAMYTGHSKAHVHYTDEQWKNLKHHLDARTKHIEGEAERTRKPASKVEVHPHHEHGYETIAAKTGVSPQHIKNHVAKVETVPVRSVMHSVLKHHRKTGEPLTWDTVAAHTRQNIKMRGKDVKRKEKARPKTFSQVTGKGDDDDKDVSDIVRPETVRSGEETMKPSVARRAERARLQQKQRTDPRLSRLPKDPEAVRSKKAHKKFDTGGSLVSAARQAFHAQSQKKKKKKQTESLSNRLQRNGRLLGLIEAEEKENGKKKKMGSGLPTPEEIAKRHGVTPDYVRRAHHYGTETGEPTALTGTQPPARAPLGRASGKTVGEPARKAERGEEERRQDAAVSEKSKKLAKRVRQRAMKKHEKAQKRARAAITLGSKEREPVAPPSEKSLAKSMEMRHALRQDLHKHYPVHDEVPESKREKHAGVHRVVRNLVRRVADREHPHTQEWHAAQERKARGETTGRERQSKIVRGNLIQHHIGRMAQEPETQAALGKHKTKDPQVQTRKALGDISMKLLGRSGERDPKQPSKWKKEPKSGDLGTTARAAQRLYGIGKAPEATGRYAGECVGDWIEAVGMGLISLQEAADAILGLQESNSRNLNCKQFGKVVADALCGPVKHRSLLDRVRFA